MSILGKSWNNLYKKYGGATNPIVEIKINGKSWSSKEAKISKINIYTSVWGEAGTCLVEIVDSLNDSVSSELKLNSDFKDIKVGTKLEISLGNVEKIGSSKTKEVFIGYIYACNMDISKDKTIVVIQGMDAKMWMMSNRKTKQIKDIKKYSKAVRQICSKNYSDKISSSKIKVSGEIKISSDSSIYQRNESDYEFICRVAKTIGALFFIDRGVLYFIDPLHYKSVKLEIDASSAGIINIKGSMDIWGIPKSVKFTAIDSKNYKKKIEASEKKPDSVGSGKAANSLVRNMPRDNVIENINSDINSSGDAKSLAKSLVTVMALNFFKVVVEMTGNPETKLGTGVKLKNIGAPFKNTYIVLGIEHIVRGTEYITRLTLGTDAVKTQDSLSLF